MPGLSSGIQIALQAVLTHSQAIEIIEHNVANATTVGYRRQSAVLSASVPTPGYGMGIDTQYGAGQRGTGVLMDRIQRFSSDFMDARYRAAASESQDWSARNTILTQLESLMAETSTSGLIPKMDQFWSGWQNLAANPSNNSLRTMLLNDANSLTEAIRSRALELTQIRVDHNKTLENQVTEINDIAGQIAKLNGEISHVQAVDEQPNDLLDRRDLLIDRLSEIAGASSFIQPNGEAIVNIGGHVLVTGQDTIQLKVEVDPDPANTDRLYRVAWSDGQALVPTSGEMKGVLTIRDQTIKDQMDGLDNLAKALISQVNNLHMDPNGRDLNGNPGGEFFVTGGNATSIRVSSSLTEANIVAGGVDTTTGEEYDNFIADKIAALKTTKVLIGTDVTATRTLNEFYNTQVTKLATETARASENSGHKNLLFTALDQQRESLSGVNLDEEAANLAKYQKAYQAAARVMTAYDELLDTIINGMGLVGR
ncbi:MAG: flagellar hook-associated protein FlgK [Anaerolineaceae bacterium]|nr:flagellar hook-associated protein FlgK [Anaerolineaceae bacterium]